MVMAVKLAELLPRYVDVKVLTEPVPSTFESASGIATGRFDIASISADKAYPALVGEDVYKDVPKDNFRLLLLAHDTVMYFVVRAESTINSMADLKGKRVMYGAPRFVTSEPMWQAILKADGLDPKDVFQVPPGTNEEMAKALIEGRIDAAQFVGGYPEANLTEAMKTASLRILSLTPKEQAVLDPITTHP